MAHDNGVGTRIRDARLARGMSRLDLARLMGVTSATVWNWETKGTRPGRSMIALIARVLGVSDGYMINGTEGGPVPTQRSYSEIIHQAQHEIALINGVPPSRVKITVEIMPA